MKEVKSRERRIQDLKVRLKSGMISQGTYDYLAREIGHEQTFSERFFAFLRETRKSLIGR